MGRRWPTCSTWWWSPSWSRTEPGARAATLTRPRHPPWWRPPRSGESRAAAARRCCRRAPPGPRACPPRGSPPVFHVELVGRVEGVATHHVLHARARADTAQDRRARIADGLARGTRFDVPEGAHGQELLPRGGEVAAVGHARSGLDELLEAVEAHHALGTDDELLARVVGGVPVRRGLGRDVERREAWHVGVRDLLDVGQGVARVRVGVLGASERDGVQRLTHRPVTDRVDVDVDAGAVDGDHERVQHARVEQNRARRAGHVGVRLQVGCGARLGGAVVVDLDHAHVQKVAVEGAAQLREALDGGGDLVGVLNLMGGHHAKGEQAPPIHVGERLESLGFEGGHPRVVDRGDAHAGEEPIDQVVGPRGGRRVEGPERREVRHVGLGLDQPAGGRAVGVALVVVSPRDGVGRGRVDAELRQRSGVDPSAVAALVDEDDGAVRDHAVEHLPAWSVGPERGLVEAEAEHEGAVGVAGRIGLHLEHDVRRTHRRRHPQCIGQPGRLHGVSVRIDEPRKHQPSAEVHRLGLGADEALHTIRIAHVDDLAVADGDRGGARHGLCDGVDGATREHQVRGLQRARAAHPHDAQKHTDQES
jgi:hypothetical protein